MEVHTDITCSNKCIYADFQVYVIQKFYSNIKTGLEKVLVSCGAVTKYFGGGGGGGGGGEAGAFGGEASPRLPHLIEP